MNLIVVQVRRLGTKARRSSQCVESADLRARLGPLLGKKSHSRVAVGAFLNISNE